MPEDEYIEDWTAEQIEREISKFVPGYVPDPEALTDAEKEARLLADIAARNTRANADRGPDVTPPRYDLTPAEQREVDRLAAIAKGIK